MDRYYLWQILKMISEGLLNDGDCFKMIDTPVDLIIEYEKDNRSLVYNAIMGDTTKRDCVSLCSGELNSLYEKCCPSCRVQRYNIAISLKTDEYFKSGFAYSASQTYNGKIDIGVIGENITVDADDKDFIFVLNATREVAESLNDKYDFSETGFDI